MMRTSVFVAVLLALPGALAAKKKRGEGAQILAPFFLQDASDGTCLGPEGFGRCDDEALWVLAPQKKKDGYSLLSLFEADPKVSCLERVGSGKESIVRTGRCKAAGAKRWDIEKDSQGYYFLTEGTGKGRHCLVRGSAKDNAKNVYRTRPCEKGYTRLALTTTVINSAPVFMQAADGKCFNGERFRTCNEYDASQLWGVFMQWQGSGDATRSFFQYGAKDRCLTRSGKKLAADSCKGKGAKDWSLDDGHLTHGAKADSCLVRLRDNTAEMRPVKGSPCEPVSLVAPDSDKK